MRKSAPGRSLWENLKGSERPDGLTQREARFVTAVRDQLDEAARAEEPAFTRERKVNVAVNTHNPVGRMKPGLRRERAALERYEAMLAHPNVRDALRAAFADAGFTPTDAVRSLQELATGKAKTIVTKTKRIVGDDGSESESTLVETIVTEHPPDAAALKQYYALTHEPATQRRENLNLNVDVMKPRPNAQPVDVTPRAVGEIGPAAQGDVNVFADDDAPDDSEPDSGEEDEEP